MRFSLLALLPAIAALQLPHIPTPQDALRAADAFLSSNVHTAAASLGVANDMNLAMIPQDEHVVITSPRHPKHRMRIKSTQGWCDPSVRSYSGFLDAGDGRDLFFYFFESRSKPEEDPVVMWINGGPGCSSSLGLFMELGPCSVTPNPTSVNDTKVNPYSWNSNANVFFLDEPLGVGFSRAEHGQTVGTSEEAAMDVQAFVSIFFEAFKEFEGRAFHMAGESYGGRYIPLFASAVFDGNKALVAEGKTPINLQSVMIGNGITDFYKTTDSYFPFQCTLQRGLNATLQSIGTCVQIAEALPKCDKLARKGCIESHDYTECTLAIAYCSDALVSPFFRAGVNPYDVSKPCTLEELDTSLCYNETKHIETYLNLADVRETLGVSKDRGDWSSCDAGVIARFGRSLDETGQTWLYVAALLERGVRVLNYAGTFDFVCNHIGNERWTEALEWSGKEDFNAAKFVDWKVDGEVAGLYKTSGHLTLLKVLYAGHMVPFDKPKEALIMLNAWLDATALEG